MKTSYKKIITAAVYGVEGIAIEMEISLMPGLPTLEIRGLADKLIMESKDRVKSALFQYEYRMPKKKVLISYNPITLPKSGTSFDLALAIGILEISELLSRCHDLPEVGIIGELGLDGSVKTVSGVLNMIYALSEKGIHEIIGPVLAADTSLLPDELKYYAVKNLEEAKTCYAGIKSDTIQIIETQNTAITLQRQNKINQAVIASYLADDGPCILDDIKGQQEAIMGVGIAIAGFHNLLLIGSPGSGKTMLARAIAQMLPPLSVKEEIVVRKIEESGRRDTACERQKFQRPFRAVHHTVTKSSLLGGGNVPYFGECTLAHKGVLFLDEMTEIRGDVIESLREPLETKSVSLSRANYDVTYPADFLLVGAANPCKCGELFEKNGHCKCTDESIRKHLAKISGPMLERFDLMLKICKVSALDIRNQIKDGKPRRGKAFRQMIFAAQNMQKARNRGFISNENLLVRDSTQTVFNSSKIDSDYCYNSKVPDNLVIDLFRISDQVLQRGIDYLESTGLSMRSLYRMLKVARTIADLNQSLDVKNSDIALACNFLPNQQSLYAE